MLHWRGRRPTGGTIPRRGGITVWREPRTIFGRRFSVVGRRFSILRADADETPEEGDDPRLELPQDRREPQEGAGWKGEGCFALRS